MKFYLIFLFFSIGLYSQVIPQDRLVNWSSAGLKYDIDYSEYELIYFNNIKLENPKLSNSQLVSKIQTDNIDKQIIIYFSEGEYLFDEAINLNNDVIIKGEGAEYTKLIFDLKEGRHSINISGSAGNLNTLKNNAEKGKNYVEVFTPNNFEVGFWGKLYSYDADLVTSEWAEETVGQILQVAEIKEDRIYFDNKLRLDINLSREPKILQIIPKKNCGIECLSILRLDNTSPTQSSNIYFNYAVNCWVKNIESENCTFSHIEARNSSNLQISGSYFHKGFEYGGGGRAYGAMLHFTTGDCLIENNIFEKLRHSMIVQAGANGNVFAYNYSLDAFWESNLPEDSAGDLVLHGNYVFANLFEGNIAQNIVIDNSHGPNGRLNTFFRNRAEKWGIFFSAANSPGQNLIANEIPNSSLPYSLVNYTIQGIDHFIYGNLVRGNIQPNNTDKLELKSLFYKNQPDFLDGQQFGGIGIPNEDSNNTIPAYDRYYEGEFTANCVIQNNIEDSKTNNLHLFPNPVTESLNISSKEIIDKIVIYDLNLREIKQFQLSTNQGKLDLSQFKSGIYIIELFGTQSNYVRKIIKK